MNKYVVIIVIFFETQFVKTGIGVTSVSFPIEFCARPSASFFILVMQLNYVFLTGSYRCSDDSDYHAAKPGQTRENHVCLMCMIGLLEMKWK